ncbi:Methylated-DNA--protein-cysteine methyltransferase [Bacillus thermotolerans]|uniref:methylated-DNA--[protein]-cysteine S-methyltransferase n=2 Tax=Bacillus thermotolerans TaxID=1221996 RepID=A0A0F5HRC2_BACTR|nr:Methylated-DNA--protein-cysteine methyltransferase [Bacillus thermotolerans]KKB36242.1 Methylated-DNA--protein-cysteine methyltransferase [Bacillus thermotolerans]KKB39049.1 Methylated-DNA--protein-cysteine methyltransferase [Bacillus thermotolerans]
MMMKQRNGTAVYWAVLIYKEWRMHVAATARGLAFVGSLHQPFDELAAWAKKRFPDSPLIEDEKKLHPYLAELIEFLQGTRQQFSLSVDYRGTPFQLDVWNALREIPYGQTWTYSDIADRINRPSAVRAVGTAIGANPLLITVPCHRVIGKNGSLTGYRGGLEMKTKLLELEQENLKD